MLKKPVIAVAVLVVLGALGMWYYVTREPATPPPAVVATAPPSAATAVAEPPIAHPLPGVAGPASPAGAADTAAPDLGDASLGSALGAAIGAAAAQDYLEPDGLIRRIVVTVDNLPRQKIPVDKRPVRGLVGAFHADGDELHATLDPQNYRRYEPLVAVVRNIDVLALTRVYVRFYPALQRAYQDLGYPNGYFNDRVVDAIDVMLAAPQLSGPIELVRPNVMYEFADRAVEALPAGQKLLIRMGPDNALAVKAKLMELRAAITAPPVKP